MLPSYKEISEKYGSVTANYIYYGERGARRILKMAYISPTYEQIEQWIDRAKEVKKEIKNASSITNSGA